MINLDEYEIFPTIDPKNMLAEIDALPEQLRTAWQFGQSLDLPEISGVRQVVIAGMGGSAIGGDLLAVYAAPQCPVPVVVQRDYDLPAWAHGAHTLVIAASHSGNTEETLSSFEAARRNGCQILAVTTGGKLARLAAEDSRPVWQFPHKGQPRAAVGWSFALLLAALTHLGLMPDSTQEIEQAVQTMQTQQAALAANLPTARNPAKRYAGQLLGRWVSVIGAGLLAPVARRWKGQISELAKAWAQFEALPEANHNTLAGILNPPELFGRSMVIFLDAPADHPRNRLRSQLTRQSFMLEGLSTDFYTAQGETKLAQIWSSLHFGDYLAYYLAMAYGVDPTPVAVIESFKREMAAAGE